MTTIYPVTLLTGFLGAGKSSLINRLLKELPGQRFGLIVNEFGQAALESQVLQVQRQSLFELPSGCLCCVSSGDLRQALTSLVAQNPRLDHILIEASGLSSPGPLMESLLEETVTMTGPRFQLSGVLNLVDASTFLARETAFSQVRSQLALADGVLLTKTDLVTPEQLQTVTARLQELRPGLTIYNTAKRLPWGLLLDVWTRPPVDEATGRPSLTPRNRYGEAGAYHGATVLEYETDQPFEPEALRRFFAELPAGLIRIKGFLHLAEAGRQSYKYLVQFTGNQKQLFSRRWERSETRRSVLLFLGTDYDSAALRQRLLACHRPSVGVPA